MTDKTCPICTNHSHLMFNKLGVDYYQCTNCKTLFSAPIDQDNMVGGGAEEERNTLQNSDRIERVKTIFGGKVDGVKVLDFGCGNGMLISDLIKYGYDAVGYDGFNEKYNTLPPKDSFHICTMIEVAEHLVSPFIEFDCIYRSLLKGGVLMVETSFVNVAEQEGIELEDFHYVAPQSGHSTIYSWHGLDLLLSKKGFSPLQHINRHVRLYIKSRW